MCRRPWRSRAHPLTVLLTAGLLVGCANGPSEPEAEPTLSLAFSLPSVTIAQGESGDMMGTATVGGPFIGSPVVTVSGVPEGVTGTVGRSTTSGNTTTVTVTITVGTSVAPDAYSITLRASGAGVSDEATLTLVVTAGAQHTLQVAPAVLTVEQGTSGTATVTITRAGGFAGEVTVGVSPQLEGLTMMVDPATTTGSGTTLRATASASLTPGTYAFDVTGTAAGEPTASTSLDVTVTPTPTTVTAHPAAIDHVLYNPGMGFTDSHFAYGYQYPEGGFTSFGDHENPPPYPDDYPPSTVAYFRWCWSAIEPAEGQIDFDRFDTIIEEAAARSEGERLGFRVMTVSDPLDCMPDWLLSKPGYVGYDGFGRHVPDYSNPVFLAALQQLYGALGARYDGHPGVDHVDLGIVGCWGEWNSACLTGGTPLCEIMGQSDVVCLETLEHVIDIMMDAFPDTPKLMLGKGEGVPGAAMDHALGRGAGWRVDCFGDWGMFGPDWSHHGDAYPGVVSRAGAAWQTGPVHLEICWTFPHWYDEFGMSTELVQETFDWALDNHASVINGKSTPVPAAYWPIVEDFLRKAGYRLVIDAVTHPATAGAGQDVLVETRWTNVGVAPPYLPHQVAFRLRDATGGVFAQTVSDADILGWLPGEYAQADPITLPEDLATGSYALDVAVLAPGGSEPAIDLAIEGRRSDGWYELSAIQVE